MSETTCQTCGGEIHPLRWYSEEPAYPACCFDSAVRAAEEELAAVTAERDRMREVLRRCELAESKCPVCNARYRWSHRSGCELAAALRMETTDE